MKKNLVILSIVLMSINAKHMLAQTTGFSDLKEALKDPKNVISLTLREKGYRRIPKELLQFENLEYLDLSMNQFKSLPNWFGQLKKLRRLVITHSDLSNINNLVLCENLEEASFNFCRIRCIPRNITSLKNLQILNLFENEVIKAPQTLCELHQLKELVIYNMNPAKQLNLQDQSQLRACFDKSSIRLVLCQEDKR